MAVLAEEVVFTVEEVRTFTFQIGLIFEVLLHF